MLLSFIDLTIIDLTAIQPGIRSVELGKALMSVTIVDFDCFKEVIIQYGPGVAMHTFMFGVQWIFLVVLLQNSDYLSICI